MATAGGTPPTGATTNSKREWTPLQKFGLPVMAGLALIVGYMYFPRGSSTPVPVSPASNAATSNRAVALTPPVTAGAGLSTLPVTPATVPGAGVPVSFISQARTDPFEPMLLYSPAPKPLPPVKSVPPPVSLPSPTDFAQGESSISIADPRIKAEVEQPLNIGSPRITRNTDAAPRDAFPLPRTSGASDGGGAVQQSYDKRLAGVVIGDGVRALLEVTSGGQATTQVVQPGDEVNGIRVLNIERFREGDRTTTRMLVRDTDGEQRYVELKPSSQPPVGTGGFGGLGGVGRGLPGGGSGFPGGPGGFPGGGFPGAGGGFPGGGGAGSGMP